jgi:deoxyguanosine kinase|tara:strand:+ start:1661 stop:2269 length:609 start_codon:yes stop_codon:yes gene_type:complete
MLKLLNNDYKYIAIEGNIGVGKTTLAKFLSKEFNGSILLEEFTENKFLKEFYKSGNYSFQMEMQFLIDRSLQMNDFFKNNHQFIFSDFHISKSLIFSKMNLDNTSYNIIKNAHLNLFQHFPKPDAVIFIDGSIENIMENIDKRNRSFEKNFKREYLEKLIKNYNSWIDNQSTPVFRIDSEEIKLTDIEELKNRFISLLKFKY